LAQITLSSYHARNLASVWQKWSHLRSPEQSRGRICNQGFKNYLKELTEGGGAGKKRKGAGGVKKASVLDADFLEDAPNNGTDLKKLKHNTLRDM